MRRFLVALSVSLVGSTGWGQQDLYIENFEGSSPSFELNTTDVGSIVDGANTWLVNSVYAGGDGLAECLGFELPFTIPATAGQPAGIGTANGNYLHTASTAAVSSGVLNCSFGAADGFCTDAGNHFARMSADVSTVGQSMVSLSFWWLCQGGTGNYGEVYYSTNSGSSWTLITTPIAQYRNQSNWVQQTVELPAFAEQTALRFGFRFVNGTTLFGAADPGFGIDDVRITAATTAPAAIATGELAGTAFCAGAAVQVAYTASGTFSAGNVFTAQLSDAAGAFATPTTIGTLTSQVSGTIPCTIPLGSPAGSGFRVRVVSSAPVTNGSVNLADITIGTPPSAGIGGTLVYCGSGSPINLFLELGGMPDVCGTWTTPDAVSFDGNFDPAVDPAGTYTYTTNCPGPCPQVQSTLQLVIQSSPGAGAYVEESICSTTQGFNPYDYINGGSSTGQFLYQGQPFPLPDFTVAGVYDLAYVVQGTSGCANDTADFSFTVVAAPNAGSSVSYTASIADVPFDLITLLPDAEEGGSWVDPAGLPFGGTLDPGTGISGIYTYTVNGQPPCEDAVSFVALVISVGMVEHDAAYNVGWVGQQGDIHDFLLSGKVMVEDVVIIDGAGRSVAAIPSSNQFDRLRVSLGDRSAGVYTLLVRTDQGVFYSRFLHAAR